MGYAHAAGTIPDEAQLGADLLSMLAFLDRLNGGERDEPPIEQDDETGTV